MYALWYVFFCDGLSINLSEWKKNNHPVHCHYHRNGSFGYRSLSLCLKEESVCVCVRMSVCVFACNFMLENGSFTIHGKVFLLRGGVCVCVNFCIDGILLIEKFLCENLSTKFSHQVS